MILKNKTKRNIFIVVLLAWPVIQWLVFTLYMNIQTIAYSFQNFNIFLGKMQFVGLDNYRNMFTSIANNTDSFGTAFRNMFLWLILNVFVIVPISTLIAYVLSKKVPLYKFYNTVYFLPNIISIVILTMLWAFMWDPNHGVINGVFDLLHLGNLKQVWLGDPKTALPIVFLYCVWAGIGWCNLILSGAIGKISPDMLEAAAIDGVTNFQEFFYITIPSIWTNLLTVVIILGAESFRVFLTPQLLTNGQYDTSSIALNIVNLVTKGDATGGDAMGLASASGVLIAVVGFTCVYIIKHFMEKLDNKWS